MKFFSYSCLGRIFSTFFLLLLNVGCYSSDTTNEEDLSKAKIQGEENTKTDPEPEPSTKGAPESVEQKSELKSNENAPECVPTPKSNFVGTKGEKLNLNRMPTGVATEQLPWALQDKVAVAKTHYPELIDESFRELITTHYLTLSANYLFATDQLNEQLLQSRQTLEGFQESRKVVSSATPKSSSFLNEVSKFSTLGYALDYEKSEASTLKKNLKDLALGWKNQCTNESLQKFVDWNDPKRMLHLGHTFQRTSISPKNMSFLFQDKTGELRKEQESLLSELSQFYMDNLERKQREAFSLSKEACYELFPSDFAEKLDQLILQAQAHENQIALEKSLYDEAWKEIKAAYSQFLLSREEEYFKDLRENYLKNFDQTFLEVARLDREARDFIETHLGLLEDEFEQVRQQGNEAKAVFKQRFWDALIQGDTQFHSGDQFYFANLDEVRNMIDRNFWHEFTGDLKPIFLFEREP